MDDDKSSGEYNGNDQNYEQNLNDLLLLNQALKKKRLEMNARLIEQERRSEENIQPIMKELNDVVNGK